MSDRRAPSWEIALDELETRIAAQREVLEKGDVTDLGTFDEPPSDLGPLPPELEGRARHVLALSQELEKDLLTAMAGIGRQLAVARRLQADHARPQAPSSFVDTSA